mmetsp:Transcript_20172/g.55964  ORF Transcript_20172/g.55964 Transcript_20172/m.55964 type:complete len:108 (-) Transcript_20172:353-676(-)
MLVHAPLLVLPRIPTASDGSLSSADDVHFLATFSKNSVDDLVQNKATIRPEGTANAIIPSEDGQQKGAGNCVEADGKRVCDLVCDELKVTQQEGGKLALQCFMTDSR